MKATCSIAVSTVDNFTLTPSVTGPSALNQKYLSISTVIWLPSTLVTSFGTLISLSCILGRKVSHGQQFSGKCLHVCRNSGACAVSRNLLQLRLITATITLKKLNLHIHQIMVDIIAVTKKQLDLTPVK